METFEPLFRQTQLGDEIIDCPATEHEWLYPDDYIGKNIVYFMARHIYLNDFVSQETINKFFHIEENWMMLHHILNVSNGHEFLTVIDNCREHITDLDLQERLIQNLLYRRSAGIYDIFVRMTSNPELKSIRHTIWMLLR